MFLLRRAPRDLSPHAVPFVRHPWMLSLAASLVMIAMFEAGPLAPSITARAEWMRPVLRLIFYGTAAMGCAGLLSYLGRAARPLYDGIATMVVNQQAPIVQFTSTARCVLVLAGRYSENPVARPCLSHTLYAG